MSHVADFSRYKDRREKSVESSAEISESATSESSDVFWLARIVKENLGKNLVRIQGIIGEKAVSPLVSWTVTPEIVTVAADIEPYGFVSIARTRKIAHLCVTNNFANMFLGATRDKEDVNTAAMYASVFSAGALVAASAALVPKIGSQTADKELWGRLQDVQPNTQMLFRFAAGVVCEVTGADPQVFRPLDNGGPLSPQLAGMINPFSLQNMINITASTYKY